MPKIDLDTYNPGDATLIWKVLEHLDKEADLGGTTLVGYFTSAEAAKESALGRGVGGGDGLISEVRIIKSSGGNWHTVGDVVEPIYCESFDAARERALEKLTDKDKAVLGIKS